MKTKKARKFLRIAAFFFNRYLIIMLISLAFVWSPLFPQKRSPEDWKLLYDHLHYIINKDGVEYPKYSNYGGAKHWPPYVAALKVMARDRDEAKQAAQEAQSQGNPYYFNQFMDLVEMAQSFGDSFLDEADTIFQLEDNFGKKHWGTLCLVAEGDGIPIYDSARKLGFNHDITRKQVQIMMKEAVRQVEHGLDYMPSYLWSFPPLPPGTANPQAEDCLSKVECIRRITKYFDLSAEYDKATELMNRYLKDALCLMDKGHRWYIKLATNYNLTEAKNYIEGFYGTLYGKVEKESSGGRTPSGFATVKVTDPHDGQTWETEADSEGNYEIKDVILHKDCSPFTITAASGQDKVIDQYDGPLEKPDRSCRYEKNLLIQKSDLLCMISAGIRWRSTSYNDEDEKTYEIKGSAGMVLTGIMLYKAADSTSESEWYEPGKFKIHYVYTQSSYNFGAPLEGCPALDRYLAGTGLATLPEYEGFDHLEIPTYRDSKYLSFVEFVLNGTQPKKIHEKKKKEGNCHVYVDDFEDMVFGSILLHVPLDKGGKISGSYAWKSNESIANAGSVPIELLYMGSPPRVAETSPQEGTPDKEEETTVMVQWNFEKLRK